MKMFVFVMAAGMLLAGCGGQKAGNAKEKAKTEIAKAEKDFAAMVAKDGWAEGFAFYAAEDAVLSRRDTLVRGKTNIRRHYLHSRLKDVRLEWAPDFVDAAESGELGYTYGRYTFSAKDSAGKAISDKGYFHTVWKKQASGEWRFVWD